VRIELFLEERKSLFSAEKNTPLSPNEKNDGKKQT
jgi:hypothetical protein